MSHLLQEVWGLLNIFPDRTSISHPRQMGGEVQPDLEEDVKKFVLGAPEVRRVPALSTVCNPVSCQAIGSQVRGSPWVKRSSQDLRGVFRV